MNSYYYARVKRGDFGDLLAEEGILRLRIEKDVQPADIATDDSNTIVAVWSTDPKKTAQLPQMLICRDGTQTDWAAWITTFAARIRPFSAYSRLITDRDYRHLLNKPPEPALGQIAWPVAGLILGEVLGASGLPDKSLETLSVTIITSTLSFVMWRAAALYPDFQEWDRLVKIWQSISQITNQRVRPIEGALVARVCASVMNAAGYQGASRILGRSDAEVSAACRSLLTSPQRFPVDIAERWRVNNIELIMRGSREDRILAFEDFLRRSENAPSMAPEVMSFIIGYLASRIAPGMIRHASVLGKVSPRYPTALLWYGFCSGFAESDSSMSEAVFKRTVDMPSSARRAIREILRPEAAIGTPTCDIGYLELVALSRTGGNLLEGVIKATPGSVVVELFPGVSTSINAVVGQSVKPVIRERKEREIIASIGDQIERLSETFRALRGIEASKEPEQGLLFPQKRKKRQ